MVTNDPHWTWPSQTKHLMRDWVGAIITPGNKTVCHLWANGLLIPTAVVRTGTVKMGYKCLACFLLN